MDLKTHFRPPALFRERASSNIHGDMFIDTN